MDNKRKAFQRLLTIMDDLREHCPWDRKQTWQSLREMTLEEVYELSDALLRNEEAEVKQELGDLMLHIVFYSKIAEEKEIFDIEEVIEGVCEKLVERHPHVYGDVEAETEEEVKQNWEQIKLNKGKKSVLEGIPASMPPIIKAMRVLQKVEQVGWKQDEIQLQQQLEEQQETWKKGAIKGEEELVGDYLLTFINYVRQQGINPESALTKAIQRFMDKFEHIENQAQEQGIPIQQMMKQQKL